jgi:hypothetical protein
MKFCNARKVTRPSNTLLRLESLDGRVLPSVAVAPAAPTLNEAVFDGSHDRHVSTFGGLAGGVLPTNPSFANVVSLYNVPLSRESHSGEELQDAHGGPIGEEIPSGHDGGYVIQSITRSSGEEIPQTV